MKPISTITRSTRTGVGHAWIVAICLLAFSKPAHAQLASLHILWAQESATQVPKTLQEKMALLQALARQRQDEGVDLSPVVEIANGVGPLIERKKFSEAETLVDQALALISRSRSGQSATDGNVEQLWAKPADAKPFACPATGAAIEMKSGDWFLDGDCTTSSLSIGGDARLWMEGVTFKVAGNVKLQQNAALHVHRGSFNIANQFKLQYHIEAADKALLDIRDAKIETNAGVTANLTSSYQGSGDSELYIENVQIDHVTSWLLCHLGDRARVETKNSPDFPSEIYPTENSTARVEGPHSSHRVWLYFLPGSVAEIYNLPASKPFTFSFGRNTPGVTGVGYQVDIVDGNVDFGIRTFPHSTVNIKNAYGNLGLDCQFSDVTAPEVLTGLKGGKQTGSFCNQDRVLELENVELPPYGWQVYSQNEDIKLADVVPVTITDSLINEMGAFKQGRFEVSHVQFAFAAVAAVGPSSFVHITNSVLNSHTIMGNNDGVVRIEDSEVYGSRVQAIGHSRIFLLNTALRINEPNPKCIPVIPSTNGEPRTRCNPFNPAREVQFITTGEGAIWVAGIDPIATAIRSGDKFTFTGNAIFKTTTDARFTYNLRYRPASASKFTDIVSGAAGPKRAEPLGEIDTKGKPLGDYIVELTLIVPGKDPVIVQRPFAITGP